MKSTPLFLALLLSSSLLHAEVKLSKVFTPHMVLQRDINAPIWGTAAAGEEVVVEFAGQKKTAKAGADGKWSVKLDPMPASAESRTLTVGGIKIDDVLVGDVWIGSGQSNMDMVVQSYVANDPVLDAASKQSYPLLRLMRKDAGATWETSTPETNVRMSALLFSFGSHCRRRSACPSASWSARWVVRPPDSGSARKCIAIPPPAPKP
jgi:sialate O-acetylesterase